MLVSLVIGGVVYLGMGTLVPKLIFYNGNMKNENKKHSELVHCEIKFLLSE